MKFNLRQARQYAGFTQDEIAKKLGIAKITYQNYENGNENRKMRVDVARRFANVVGIPMDQIIF